jgi:hypothetical protein
MTIAERIEHLEEDILDADCCTDGDCGCHRTAREARRELEKLRAGMRWCDGCGTDRPVEGMTFAKGEDTHTEYAFCSTCSTAAHDAAVESLYREQYGDDFDRLATYQAEGR